MTNEAALRDLRKDVSSENFIHLNLANLKQAQELFSEGLYRFDATA